MLFASICYIFPAFHHFFWVAYLCQMQRVRGLSAGKSTRLKPTLELVASAPTGCVWCQGLHQQMLLLIELINKDYPLVI